VKNNLQQLNKSARILKGISTVTHQAASGTQQVAKATEDLNRLTDNLLILISKFKFVNSKSSYSVRENGKLIEV
jgi:methyl-accepting chemotaxis protein